jgi:hypothetical protein
MRKSNTGALALVIQRDVKQCPPRFANPGERSRVSGPIMRAFFGVLTDLRSPVGDSKCVR